MTKPKTTFLLAGHGSRNREGNDEIERFADQWRQKHPDWRIEVCFINTPTCCSIMGSTAPPKTPNASC